MFDPLSFDARSFDSRSFAGLGAVVDRVWRVVLRHRAAVTRLLRMRSPT
jgi:hypothetical protein